MKRPIWTVLPAFALLAACGGEAAESEDVSVEAGAPQNKFGFQQATSQGILPADRKVIARTEAESAEAVAAAGAAKAADDAVPGPASEIPVSVPRIAYAYIYGFRVSGGDMPGLQRRHADLCEKQGLQTCRVLEMSQSGGDDQYAYGKLVMAVAAPQARAFGDELGKAAEGAGGSLISSAISGEDLSKQIVDTEARLRARILLRDRLMELLASRKGTVSELIEAERGVAEVNQEIDEAQSWLKEMKGRVDFSRVQINYESASRSGGGFLGPILTVFDNLGAILGVVIAGLIAIIVTLVPISLFVFGLLWLRRRIKAGLLLRNQHDTAETVIPDS